MKPTALPCLRRLAVSIHPRDALCLFSHRLLGAAQACLLTVIGQFKLIVAVQQSADFKTYTSLSLATGSLSVKQAGEREFRFNGQTGAAFYRLQSQ